MKQFIFNIRSEGDKDILLKKQVKDINCVIFYLS